MRLMMRNILNNRKGFVYTIFAIAIITVFLAMILIRTTTVSREKIIKEELRTSQLLHIISDVFDDMERAMTISATRSLIATINWEISTGNFTPNFTSTMQELLFNGTIGGEPQPFVENSTLPYWSGKIENILKQQRIEASLVYHNITVDLVGYFKVRVTTNVSVVLVDRIEDAMLKRNETMSTVISAEGIEDPFVTIGSLGFITNNFRLCPWIKGNESSGSVFYGKALVDYTTTNFSFVPPDSGLVLVTDTLLGKTNYGNFAGIIIQRDENPSSVDYVSGVENISMIRNGSYVVVSANTVYLTNITDSDCIFRGVNSCYFPVSDAPTVLDRIEGRNYHTDIYDKTGKYGIASFICTASLPSELRKGNEILALDYKYLPLT